MQPKTGVETCMYVVKITFIKNLCNFCIVKILFLKGSTLWTEKAFLAESFFSLH